jgi:hypothetical protein
MPELSQLWKITVDSIFDEFATADDLVNLYVTGEQSLKYQPSLAELSCNDAINELIFELPKFGSMFYAFANGLYFGQYGDYASCQTMAFNA